MLELLRFLDGLSISSGNFSDSTDGLDLSSCGNRLDVLIFRDINNCAFLGGSVVNNLNVDFLTGFINDLDFVDWNIGVFAHFN